MILASIMRQSLNDIYFLTMGAITDTHSGTTLDPFPHRATLLLCVLFAILFGVWILPHTVFLRLFCFVSGGLLGLWAIYRYRSLLWQKRSLPIALILLLLLWVTIHLFWIGKDFNAQSLEYAKIWKKIALSLPFAIGLGLAIASNFSNPIKCRRYWQIIFLGFCLPTLIYFAKLTYAKFSAIYGYPIPKYLLLIPYDAVNPFGLARAWYVFFCLPAFAIALGCLARQIELSTFTPTNSWPYIVILPMTVFLFFIESDRLGMVYITILLMLFLGLVFSRYFKNLGWGGWAALMVVASISLGLVGVSVTKNLQWKTLVADAKVAVQVDRFDHWKNRSKGYPINENGQIPTDSNYSRIAWAIVGSHLLLENPLGYGLMSISFSALGKAKWPDSDLSWTHSAWLDFALGYGFPGVILLGLATWLAWRQSTKLQAPWCQIGRWGLLAMTLVMTTKEVSAETVINALVFLIVWLAAISLAKIDKARIC